MHSPFLQSLAALSVGLELDRVLCSPLEDPHDASRAQSPCEGGVVPTWSWLHVLAVTIRTADALSTRTALPDSFVVPEHEPVQDPGPQPRVSTTHPLEKNDHSHHMSNATEMTARTAPPFIDYMFLYMHVSL